MWGGVEGVWYLLEGTHSAADVVFDGLQALQTAFFSFLKFSQILFNAYLDRCLDSLVVILESYFFLPVDRLYPFTGELFVLQSHQQLLQFLSKHLSLSHQLTHTPLTQMLVSSGFCPYIMQTGGSASVFALVLFVSLEVVVLIKRLIF